jgi:hypothetical protein
MSLDLGWNIDDCRGSRLRTNAIREIETVCTLVCRAFPGSNIDIIQRLSLAGEISQEAVKQIFQSLKIRDPEHDAMTTAK